MKQEINLLDRYPRSNRPITERGQLVTEAQRAVARQFDVEYFDGERLTGYGGYHYHPRFWEETVQRVAAHYQLSPTSSLLDVGCAKGFMLYEFWKWQPGLTLAGLDISHYALERAIPEVAPVLQQGSAHKLPYADDSFDLVISINTIHNLAKEECKQALREIERVSRGQSFITVDAWRNEKERQNLASWNLTALTFMHVEEWKALFDEVGYSGDYYWFIAQ